MFFLRSLLFQQTRILMRMTTAVMTVRRALATPPMSGPSVELSEVVDDGGLWSVVIVVVMLLLAVLSELTVEHECKI